MIVHTVREPRAPGYRKPDDAHNRPSRTSGTHTIQLKSHDNREADSDDGRRCICIACIFEVHDVLLAHCLVNMATIHGRCVVTVLED